jgi:biopolymer transport protein ExbB/TolQ
MGFGRKAARYVARPIYRKFVEGPLWWFLAKLKVFFIAEIAERLTLLEQKLTRLETIEDRLRSTEISNAAQWDALEQLLLAMFRQREQRLSGPGREGSAQQYTPLSDATDVNRVNEPNTVR